MKRGTIEDFFDFDIEQANKLKEGNRPIYIDEETNKIYYWCTLPTNLLNSMLKRKHWPFQNINEQSSFGLYEQIKSQKQQNKQKI